MTVMIAFSRFLIYTSTMEIKTKRLVLLTLNKKTFKRYKKDGCFQEAAVQDNIKYHLRLFKGDRALMVWSIWAVTLRSTGQVIGEIGFHGMANDQGEVDLGYKIYSSHQKMGYGSEGVEALVNYVEGLEGEIRVLADCLKDNIASIALLEKHGFISYKTCKDMFYYRRER